MRAYPVVVAACTEGCRPMLTRENDYVAVLLLQCGRAYDRSALDQVPGTCGPERLVGAVSGLPANGLSRLDHLIGEILPAPQITITKFHDLAGKGWAGAGKAFVYQECLVVGILIALPIDAAQHVGNIGKLEGIDRRGKLGNLRGGKAAPAALEHDECSIIGSKVFFSTGPAILAGAAEGGIAADDVALTWLRRFPQPENAAGVPIPLLGVEVGGAGDRASLANGDQGRESSDHCSPSKQAQSISHDTSGNASCAILLLVTSSSQLQ